MNKFCLIIPMLLAASARVIAADAVAPGTNLVIGLLLPPEEAQAASLRDGAQLAVEQANKTPGKQVSLIVRGRVGQWGADAVEAARMVLDDGAAALIAPPDGAATHLALQVAGRTAAPVISLCADSSVSRTGVPWMLRVVPRTVDEAGAVFAHFNTVTNPIKRWVDLVPPDRAGREISSDLKKAATTAGCVLEKTFELAVTNHTSVMAQMVKANPEGVLIWLDPKLAGACVKLLRLAGFSGTVAGPMRLHTPEFVTAAGASLERFVLPGLVLDEDSQARFEAFQIVFRRQFQREPDITAALSFDAAALLIQILRTNEPASLPRVFPLDFSVPGVSGVLAFDAEGNRKLPLQLLVGERGTFVPLRNTAREPGEPGTR